MRQSKDAIPRLPWCPNAGFLMRVVDGASKVRFRAPPDTKTQSKRKRRHSSSNISAEGDGSVANQIPGGLSQEPRPVGRDAIDRRDQVFGEHHVDSNGFRRPPSLSDMAPAGSIDRADDVPAVHV